MLLLMQVRTVASDDGRLHQGRQISASQRNRKTFEALEDARHGSEACEQSPPNHSR